MTKGDRRMLSLELAPGLIYANLYHLLLDGKQVGTVNVFSGCYDKIQAALEALPEAGYLLEEKTRKLENAELLIEHLKREVKELDFSVALHDRAAKKALELWKEAHPETADVWPSDCVLMAWLMNNLTREWERVEVLRAALQDLKKHASHEWIRNTAEAALRTTEESSVIDNSPAKQPEDGAEADGDGDSVIDDNPLQVELVRLAEKSLGEVEE